MVFPCRGQILLPSGKLQSHSLSPTRDAPALSNRTCHIYVNHESKSEKGEIQFPEEVRSWSKLHQRSWKTI
jgi:hypothetical protein